MDQSAALHLYHLIEEHQSQGGAFAGYVYNHTQTEHLPVMSFCFKFNSIGFHAAMNDCEGNTVECVSFYNANDDTLSYSGHSFGNPLSCWDDYANITFRLADIVSVEVETKNVLNSGDKIIEIQMQNGQSYAIALTNSEPGNWWNELLHLN